MFLVWKGNSITVKADNLTTESSGGDEAASVMDAELKQHKGTPGGKDID